jgi:hypothetical protein
MNGLQKGNTVLKWILDMMLDHPKHQGLKKVSENIGDMGKTYKMMKFHQTLHLASQVNEHKSL